MDISALPAYQWHTRHSGATHNLSFKLILYREVHEAISKNPFPLPTNRTPSSGSAYMFIDAFKYFAALLF